MLDDIVIISKYSNAVIFAVPFVRTGAGTKIAYAAFSIKPGPIEFLEPKKSNMSSTIWTASPATRGTIMPKMRPAMYFFFARGSLLSTGKQHSVPVAAQLPIHPRNKPRQKYLLKSSSVLMWGSNAALVGRRGGASTSPRCSLGLFLSKPYVMNCGSSVARCVRGILGKSSSSTN